MGIPEKRELIQDPNGPTSNDEGEFIFSVGSSVLTNFLLALSPSNILTELAQNEYDAGGNRLDVFFKKDQILIVGNGKPIDGAGWKRLSVMLGTGFATGTETEIEPKSNGIGSMNYGLRSLFLYGNQIRVSSNGKFTLLDIKKGVYRKPHEESTSRGKHGIEVVVPFRAAPLLSLRPFGIDEEAHVLDTFSSNISLILMKLANASGRKSLNVVTVRSRRCNRTLRWRQSARFVHSKTRGVFVIRRRIRVIDSSIKKIESHFELNLNFKKT